MAAVGNEATACPSAVAVGKGSFVLAKLPAKPSVKLAKTVTLLSCTFVTLVTLVTLITLVTLVIRMVLFDYFPK
jgi:hypothetical protein